MLFSTLLDTAAASQGATLTIRTGSGEPLVRRFPELVADVRQLCAGLAAAGLQRGHYVGLQAANTYEFVAWDLALVELGAIAHVFPEQWTLEEIRAVTLRYRLAGCVSRQLGNMCLPGSGGAPFDRLHVEDCDRATDADLLTRVYSSGTSGYLKGLVIGRAGVEDVATQFASSFELTPGDRHLFFLTMTHFQQRLTVYTCLAAGVSLMITPYTHVLHDLPRFKPTFFVAPPVFYELALSTLVPRGAEAAGATRMKTIFGEQFRFLVTGMAPIRRDVLESYRRYGVPLLEAYGMTEIGLIAWNTPRDNILGTVGRPLATHELTFTEDGEILVKAPHHFAKCYFDVDDEEAARTFIGDGFIATGDIGELVGTHLVLRGRKKDIIIAGDGHKFHPATIEARILACADVLQAYVVGDPLRGEIVAVVSVADKQDAATIAAVGRAIASANQGVTYSARIARTVLTETRFTPENGLLTPTLKPNRSAIARQFVTPAGGMPVD